MKKVIILGLFTFIISAIAMECPPPLEDRIQVALFARKMSCILGRSCECPAYLSRCRYFHEHIQILVELDRKELAYQAKLDELRICLETHPQRR